MNYYIAQLALKNNSNKENMKSSNIYKRVIPQSKAALNDFEKGKI